MQKHRSTSILVILFLGCTLVSITIFAGAHDQISQKALAINTTATSVQSTNGSSITLGTPQIYTACEQHYFTGLKPTIINGTHELEESFTGHEILNGSIVSIHGKIFVTNGTAGAGRIQTVVGYNVVHGNTPLFRGIDHIGADGKIRDIGTIINTKGMIGIYKGEIDKNGNAITKVWFWK